MSEQAIKLAISDVEIIHRTAAEMFHKAEECRNNPAQKEYFLGLSAYELKEYDHAYDHLRESERLEPAAETGARLALCCWRQRQLDDAAKWIQIAINRDPSGEVLARCIGITATYTSIYAAIELERGNIDQALKAANDVVSSSKADPLANLTRANALLAKGDHQEAYRALDVVASDAPPYLLRQIDALKTVARSLFESSSAARPLLAEFSAIAALRAI